MTSTTAQRGQDTATPGQPAIPVRDFRGVWEAADIGDWEARGATRHERDHLLAWSDAWNEVAALAEAWAGLDAERPGDVPAIVDIERQLWAMRDRTAEEVIQRVTDWQRGHSPAQDVDAGALEARLAAWHERFGSDRNGDGPLREAINEYADLADPTFEHPDGFIDQNEGTLALFTDLRPSEAKRLYELMEAARSRAQVRARRVILEEIAAAASIFAAEHPDAPRP
jgi:hypothetical protein